MNRLVKAKTVLPDGTVLPKGSVMVVAAAHFDPTVYENPNEFDAWRFAREGEKGAGHNAKAQLVGTNPHFLAFGYVNPSHLLSSIVNQLTIFQTRQAAVPRKVSRGRDAQDHHESPAAQIRLVVCGREETRVPGQV